MPMRAMSFGKDEEKLSLAWDQIGLLWESVFALKARADMDSIATCALLHSGGSAARVREIWERESSALIGAHSAAKRGEPEFELAARQLRERATFWNEQFESLEWPAATHRH